MASSNPGKLREYQALASPEGAAVDLAFIPKFDSLPIFEEIWPTFAENAAGKALHYSRSAKGMVIADDSGLVVPALGGAPGVLSARYAGPGATDMDRIHKLLSEMRGKKGGERQARFVCVVAVAEAGNLRGLFSAAAEGIILEEPRGRDGFGYDPIFLFPALGKTYAEISREEKNLHSHRGKAFHRALDFLLQAKK
ncbi:MAG TPA: RdgB/HAM1 family non-canonical purine NTP pyrophosphatase [Candidatus Acidoferrales bacterium]|nr:RdgB/HAM1 family non-canonical purine NTP pyrophosphatase [Candidatus Acidoferrales bacterium]